MEERRYHTRGVALQNAILASLGHPLPRGAAVLDFGCGGAGTVDAYRDAGYDAYGSDITLEEPSDRRRLIETPYRLPFEDESFDFVCSDQVLEHVQDHDLAFREIRRVLRPRGTSLHFYPPRWRLREGHVYVPLASVIQTRPWLWLWATLGIRNEFQQDLATPEVVEANYHFLHTKTNYLSRRRMLALAHKHFCEARYVERAYLKNSPTRATRPPPSLARLYSDFQARVLFMLA